MKQEDRSTNISGRKHRGGFDTIFLILSGAMVAYVAIPLGSVFTFTDLSELMRSIARPEIGNAFFLSLATATVSTLLLATFGIPLAYSLVRYNFRGKFLLRLLTIIPLVLPPLASGTLLLGIFGPYTLLGRSFTIEFTQSVIGVIIAQTYVSSPFMILSAQSAFESVDESYEKVARVLGKSRLETFVKVSLPLAKTGIMIGFILSWVRSVGELGATMMMTYNPHTISIQIFEDNAIGGMQHAVPGILLLIIMSIMVLAVFSVIKRGEGLRLRW